MKQPSIFYRSPQSIGEHIDILRFASFNKNKEVDTEVFWNKTLNSTLNLTCSSNLLLTKNLIIPKMFENQIIPKNLKGAQLKQKFETYLTSNPDKEYVLNISKFDTETDCINLLKKYLSELTL